VPGRIARRTIDLVRERADLVELVEARTGPVRKTGAQVMARCPFHDERTPSLSVHPVDKLYNCFGCGERGDVFSFVMKLENVAFDEAVSTLAERYGIELEYEELSAADQRRMDEERRLESLLGDARSYYQRVLTDSPAAEEARAYVRERGIDAAMAERFGLGFALPEWDRLARAALQKGYRRDELERAGLTSAGQRGPIDVFRNRLMFPLTDARGRVRGFAGRVMPGEEGAKYINTRETELFKKSQLLYGLHEARPAIGRTGRAIVVEGYTDVIHLHAAGFDNAVAAMGTSLTEEQLRELRRLCRELILAFDADAAGQGAALRGLRLAEERGFDVHVVPLPAGQDPAELAQQGVEAVESALARSRRVLEFEIDVVLARVGEEDPDTVYAAAREVLGRARESILRQEQVRRVSSALRLDPRMTAALVRQGRPRYEATLAAPERLPDDMDVRRERDFLAAVVAAPAEGAAALDAAEEGGHLVSRPARAIVPWVRARLAGADEPPPAGLEPEAAGILATAGRYGDRGDVAVRELGARLELATRQRERDALKQKLLADDESEDTQRALVVLDRRIAAIEEGLRGG